MQGFFSQKIMKCLTQIIPWGKRAQPGPHRAAQWGGDGTSVGVAPRVGHHCLPWCQHRGTPRKPRLNDPCSLLGSRQEPTPGGVVSVPRKRLWVLLCVTSPGGDFSVASPQHTGR